MTKLMLKLIIDLLDKMMSKENMILIADALLDKIEEIVIDSANTIDDAIILPVVKKIRDTFGIIDND